MKRLLTALVFCSSFALGAPASRTLSHALGTGPVVARTAASGDTLRILAVMVQFQTDNDIRTSGTGHFDLSDSVERIIDAPPRDSAYFADHFRFARNYFSKVSNGRQHIAATVMGRVVTLPNRMQTYAPLSGNLPLTNLIEDAWHAADSLNPGFPFNAYDLFVIFHAGSGKDVDLRGSLGYDPTPYDLPSIYFNLPSLQKLRGATYAGVRLSNAFTITNSAVLPETENRIIPGNTGDFLLQLGINGLVVANIASHLGLPDLFDTKTGRTAIGRFGLMDGQSIFSYSGLFPPAPSAWERVRLGWTKAVTPAASATASTQHLSAGYDTVYRVPISAKEYFLLENRQRDRNNDGATLTLRWRGQEFSKTFRQDDDHFNSANVDSVYGTLVDVDEVDWSLPGLINSSNNYTGGMLIWHIDETVIDQQLPTNTINADETHRGVNLMEADGSQDIGQSYGLTDPGAGSEDGSPIDYWFAKNISPVYTNEFSETSHPNSLSNTKAHSHVTINHFGDSAPMMTFDVSTGDASVQLAGTIKRHATHNGDNDAPVAADLNSDGMPDILYTSGDTVFVAQASRVPYAGNPTGVFATSGGLYQPAIIDKFTATGGVYAALVADSTVRLYSMNTAGVVKLERSFNAGTWITTPVYSRLIGTTGTRELAVGTADGRIVVITDAGVTSTKSASQSIWLLSYNGAAWTAVPSGMAGVQDIAVATLEQASDHSLLTVHVDAGNGIRVTTSTGSIVSRWTVRGGIVNTALALSDVNGDGATDILLGTNVGVFAYNLNGTLIEHYPLKTLDGGQVVGTPVVFKKANASTAVICFGSTQGQVYAYTPDGQLLPGFPLQTGGILSSLTAADRYLIAASSDSSMYFWNVGNVFDLTASSWSSYLGNAAHTNDQVAPTGPVVNKSDALLTSSLVYNWPNPVYNGTTHIRYYLGKAASVTVKIYTIAGESVATLHGTGAAHTDNEIDWDVGGVQSGIYLAHVEASAQGETGSAIIKIAVVK